MVGVEELKGMEGREVVSFELYSFLEVKGVVRKWRWRRYWDGGGGEDVEEAEIVSVAHF